MFAEHVESWGLVEAFALGRNVTTGTGWTLRAEVGGQMTALPLLEGGQWRIDVWGPDDVPGPAVYVDSEAEAVAMMAAYRERVAQA